MSGQPSSYIKCGTEISSTLLEKRGVLDYHHFVTGALPGPDRAIVQKLRPLLYSFIITLMTSLWRADTTEGAFQTGHAT